MPKWNFRALVSHLESEYGDDLRWVASFDSDAITYKVRYVRDDLKTDLSDQELQVIIHRSMALFNRRHVEDAYFHLDDARALLVEYEGATAVHLYLNESRGVVVKLAEGTEVSMPSFREACMERLES